MSDDGHKYFFGQMPQMPWKREDEMSRKVVTQILVNDDPEWKDINQRAFDALRKSTNYDEDLPMCTASNNGYVCTREKGHVGPHVATGVHDICAVWLDKFGDNK